MTACLRSEMINEGALALKLEQTFLERFGGVAAAACGSGSQALLIALKALEVGAGAEVIVPSYVCAEVLATIEAIGAVAVIVDVDDDFLLSVEHASAAITPDTRAILLPYVMGIWRDPSAFKSLGVPLIEDCAQYLPPRGECPLNADVAIFSFEATKVIAAGEGGLVLARNPEIAGRLRSLKRLAGTEFKLNLYPLSDILAALALHQMAKVDEFLASRAALAAHYFRHLSSLREWRLPHAFEGRSTFFRFPLRCSAGHDRDIGEILAELTRHNVICRRPVDTPLHRLRRPRSPCPKSDELHATTVSIPIYPSLADCDRDKVVSVLLRVLG